MGHLIHLCLCQLERVITSYSIHYTKLYDFEYLGYWTSTASFDSDYFIWIVPNTGALFDSGVDETDYFGVRPVITISKYLIE